MNEDITLKSFCNTRKGNEGTVCKIGMEVIEPNTPLKSLIEPDFETWETAIDMRSDLNDRSKNNYKSILSYLKDRIHRIISDNIQLAIDRKVSSWEDLRPCIYRQKNSRNIIVCRNKSPPIDKSWLTPDSCKLCAKVNEQLAMYEKTLGVKPKLRGLKALNLMNEMLQISIGERETIEKDRDFYKTELGHRDSQIQTLQNNLNREQAEKQSLFAKIDEFKARQKMLDKEINERADERVKEIVYVQTEEEKERLAKETERVRALTKALNRMLQIFCPELGDRVSMAEKCSTCEKMPECSPYWERMIPQ